MSIFTIEENIKKDFTVGDFYTLKIFNLGMSGSLEEEAKKMFKVSLSEMKQELKNTPLKEFERLFFKSDQWGIIRINPKDMRVGSYIRMLMLKRFLRKWVKKKYRSGYNNPYCMGGDKSIKYIHIYNGEVIEYATGANMMFVFNPK